MSNSRKAKEMEQERQKNEAQKTLDRINKDDTEIDDNGTDKQPRLSFYFESSSIKQNPNRERVLDEIDRVEQLITLNLQKINENLMQSNSIVSNKLIPSLEAFNKSSSKIYNNISHIKEFFENAANVNILTKKDIDLQKVNDSDTSHDQSRTSGSIEEGKLASRLSLSENNGGANNVSSELSEFKDIKDRYKQNLESAGEKDLTVTHTTTTLRLNKLPDYLKDNSNSLGTETFLRDFKINAEDESTGKQVKRRPLSTGEGEIESKSSSKGEVTEENLTNNYVKDIVAGYESPPWEEPPVLQSSKFTGGNAKKRSRSLSSAPDKSGSFRGDKDVDVENGDRQTKELDSENEEEEISIRFPSSPKYGAGGKLLRTDKGRQRALDFALSEMMKYHPILSLQPQKSTSQRENGGSTQNPFDSTAEKYDTSNSTLEDAPELMSELLTRRRQQQQQQQQHDIDRQNR